MVTIKSLYEGLATAPVVGGEEVVEFFVVVLHVEAPEEGRKEVVAVGCRGTSSRRKRGCSSWMQRHQKREEKRL